MNIKPVLGFPGYFASDDGKIFTSKYRKTGNGKKAGWAIGGPLVQMSTNSDRYGYHQLRFSIDGKSSHSTVGVFVALAFLGARPKGLVVAHLDGNKTNNHVKNLAYVSQSENMRHRRAHGTAPIGEKANRAKLKEDQVREIIVRLDSGELASALAREFGVGDCAIGLIKSGKTWSHLREKINLYPAGTSAGLIM